MENVINTLKTRPTIKLVNAKVQLKWVQPAVHSGQAMTS